MNKPLQHLFIECLRWFSHFSISIYHSDSYWFLEPLYKEKPPPLLMREFPNYEYELIKFDASISKLPIKKRFNQTVIPINNVGCVFYIIYSLNCFFKVDFYFFTCLESPTGIRNFIVDVLNLFSIKGYHFIPLFFCD